MPAAEILIVGGGIVGLATARALTELAPDVRLTLLEKEPEVGQHQSSHNSGVLHAGVAYAPGSQKALLVRRGIRMMVEFCQAHDIRYEMCGKLVVASDESQIRQLHALHTRCQQNGLEGLRLLSAEAAQEIEPHVRCAAALLVPGEGIVDFSAVCRALARDVEKRGVTLRTREEVRSIDSGNGGWTLQTPKREYHASFLINCAGLQVDRVLAMTGEKRPCRIVPFRGEYYRITEDRQGLVRNLVYPLPEPGFPFLGAHFTRRITGIVEAGPNAVLALAREGYRKGDLRVRDLSETLTFPGLWRFVAAHRQMVAVELRESFSKQRYLRRLQKMVPEIRDQDLVPGSSGVRAQAMLPSGALVDDFLLFERPRALHALNVPSPAATAALAIGAELANRALTQLSPTQRHSPA